MPSSISACSVEGRTSGALTAIYFLIIELFTHSSWVFSWPLLFSFVASEHLLLYSQNWLKSKKSSLKSGIFCFLLRVYSGVTLRWQTAETWLVFLLPVWAGIDLFFQVAGKNSNKISLPNLSFILIQRVTIWDNLFKKQSLFKDTDSTPLGAGGGKMCQEAEKRFIQTLFLVSHQHTCKESKRNWCS